MLLNDRRIRELAQKGMIEPFVSENMGQGAQISYGLTSFGYDLRVADEFKIFTNIRNAVVDPKQISAEAFVDFQGSRCIIPPNSFALARSVEYFRIPDDIMVLCVGKSTYARCGIITNVTPLEPGWEGHVTLEISNTSTLPAVVYANEGLCQVLFFQAERPVSTYADRHGKYQGQIGITLPRI